MSGGEHGYNAYTHGCRCQVCRQAKADYMRDRRATGRALASRWTVSRTGRRGNGATARAVGARRHVADNVTHGTRSAYDEAGCRCDPCTDARLASDARKPSRARRATTTLALTGLLTLGGVAVPAQDVPVLRGLAAQSAEATTWHACLRYAYRSSSYRRVYESSYPYGAGRRCFYAVETKAWYGLWRYRGLTSRIVP